MEYLLDGLSPGHDWADIRGIHTESARLEGVGKDTLQFFITRIYS